MPNILNDLWTRIKTDYADWRRDQITQRSFRVKQKMIRKALKRAIERNKEDKRTYYIMEDLRGGISALHKDDLNFWTARGLFPKMTQREVLGKAIDIVTSDRGERDKFNQIVLSRALYERDKASKRTKK